MGLLARRLQTGLGLLTLCAVLASGCGGSGPGAQPGAFVGSYTVVITSNGKTDMDEMTITQGSGSAVLLSFVFGFSTIRANVIGSTDLVLPRQTLHVDHSTGVSDGQATGDGTLMMDGSFDMTIHLTGTGIGPIPDGGTMPMVDYHVTGTKSS
jgi:hypothetical protein